ncbi:DinB family protein [Paenibacillus chibensis]|uniref:DinB family protein n=1 Tax=Paenibacillus chibensis TaxID=59846 RepID=UPI000FD931DF
MLNTDQIYQITDIPGYSPEVGRLLSMMNYARHTTLQAVEGLQRQQLDHLLDPKSNSIGMLLLHFAAVEYAYQVGTFEGRELSEGEIDKWGPALKLGAEGREHIQGHDLAYYLSVLSEVRNRSFELFQTVDDEWLHVEEPFWNNKSTNRYFMWFHVLEDEINHRGQIRWIRKRVGEEERP